MRLHTFNFLATALTVGVLPGTNAFWMKILWKNGENGQSVIDNDFANLNHPNPAKISRTLTYPKGAYKCGLVSELAIPGGPTDPIPGIITIANSKPLGTDADYILFWDNDSCDKAPAAMLRPLVPADKQSEGGHVWFFDLMDRGFPQFKRWRQLDPQNAVDKKIANWLENTDKQSAFPNSSGYFWMTVPSQGGNMRWGSIVRVIPIPPQAMKNADPYKVSRTLTRGLKESYEGWWAKESVYLQEQANLNTDFGSPDFNFVPKHYITGDKVPSYMADLATTRWMERYQLYKAKQKAMLEANNQLQSAPKQQQAPNTQGPTSDMPKSSNPQQGNSGIVMKKIQKEVNVDNGDVPNKLNNAGPHAGPISGPKPESSGNNNPPGSGYYQSYVPSNYRPQQQPPGYNLASGQQSNVDSGQSSNMQANSQYNRNRNAGPQNPQPGPRNPPKSDFNEQD
ncbi:hypothetical protein AA313_de0201662 [Arthrobotrys entomopaga]|nr:hypothetical protein AA313_de0201662 [Arthrobotrys entomopaga]